MNFQLIHIFAIFAVTVSQNVPTSQISLLRITQIAQCTAPGNICLAGQTSECSRGFAVCLGAGMGYNVPCPDSTPYCITNSSIVTCTGQAPTACQGAATSDFQCAETGVYPNPTACNRFVSCVATSNGQLVATEGNCPGNYVFTPNVPVIYCKRRVSLLECVTVSCQSVQMPTFLPYGTLYKQYYAYCENSNSTARIFKCPDNHVVDLSPFPPRCTFVCPREGIFASPNRNNFYFCYFGTNGRLTFREQSCPAGFVFDEDIPSCVAETTTLAPVTQPSAETTGAPEVTTSSSQATEVTEVTEVTEASAVPEVTEPGAGLFTRSQ